MHVKTFYRTLRVVSAITLFFFSWSFLPIFQAVAYAVEPAAVKVKGQSTAGSGQGVGGKGQGNSSERFEKALDAIRENVNKSGERLVKGEDDSAERTAIRAKKAEIESLDVELKKEFGETEKKLISANLPKEILDRHARFVKHYEDNLKELTANLDDVEKSKAGSDRKAKIAKARLHLDMTKTPSRHTPLDPNNLPHRTVKAKERKPRLKKEEFERDFPSQKKSKFASDNSFWTRIADSVLHHYTSSVTPQSSPVLLAYNEFASNAPLQLPLHAGEDGSLPSFAFDNTAFLYR